MMVLSPRLRALTCALAVLVSGSQAAAQTTASIAKEWNEALLDGIRNDLARPTVHARNLFHHSIALYDLWAVYDAIAEPYLLGKSVDGYLCTFNGMPVSATPEADRHEAMSYASLRLLTHRFRNSPGALLTLPRFEALLVSHGYDPGVTTTDYATGDPAALGNYVAQCLIGYGMQDGAREGVGYSPDHYAPVNPPMEPAQPGNPNIVDLNRWQPLQFDRFIDQSGNEIPGGIPEFVGPEWGAVSAFALPEADRTVRDRDGEFVLYADPGPPPYLLPDGSHTSDEYKWGFALVGEWSGHLDAADGVTWDISPGTLGGLAEFPTEAGEVREFYRRAGLGEIGTGHPVNPATGQPYAPNVVPRGDYTRVLAEFWADGPDSETPPGHWYAILNEVGEHPDLERRWNGQGPELSPLEWDVKTYFALGGAVHDAAVTAWALKGWYDYIRPISALRAMAERGQSTEQNAPDYHPEGLPLADGQVERIAPGDPLAGSAGEHVGKLKLWGWLGPDLIEDPETDVAGVGWIRVEDWWPYQRPTFVTPPFAGYVSGHSTFSRAAAEVLTYATGDPFFPGGMGEFLAPAGTFLVFEDGPTVDVTLQWATYRDAADQCSLSRIWGGIHPPADDLPGRRLGEAIGLSAVAKAEPYFEGIAVSSEVPPVSRTLEAYPSPVRVGEPVTVTAPDGAEAVVVVDLRGRQVATLSGTGRLGLDTGTLAPGLYVLRAVGTPHATTLAVIR
ncbi:MAG: hypothetical protein AAGI52_18025 [Bacteroidota bacterium]